jgi:hypothetical protein
VRLCIRALGDWTKELKALADKMADKGEVSTKDRMIIMHKSCHPHHHMYHKDHDPLSVFMRNLSE